MVNLTPKAYNSSIRRWACHAQGTLHITPESEIKRSSAAGTTMCIIFASWVLCRFSGFLTHRGKTFDATQAYVELHVMALSYAAGYD